MNGDTGSALMGFVILCAGMLIFIAYLAWPVWVALKRNLGSGFALLCLILNLFVPFLGTILAYVKKPDLNQ